MKRQYQRHTKESLALVVAESTSFTDVARKLGKSPVGGTTTHIKKMCLQWEINIEHMTGQAHNRGKQSTKRLPPDKRLVLGSPSDVRIAAHKLRRCLLELGVAHVCAECGISEWNGRKLTLEIDHIDGRYWNNVKTNLQFLCPNCHSQKPVDRIKLL